MNSMTASYLLLLKWMVMRYICWLLILNIRVGFNVFVIRHIKLLSSFPVSAGIDTPGNSMHTHRQRWKCPPLINDMIYKSCLLFSDNKILVVGGMGLDTNPRDTFVEFDVADNKWQKLPSMPTARYAAFTFIINNKLYVIGKVYYYCNLWSMMSVRQESVVVPA